MCNPVINVLQQTKFVRFQKSPSFTLETRISVDDLNAASGRFLPPNQFVSFEKMLLVFVGRRETVTFGPPGSWRCPSSVQRTPPHARLSNQPWPNVIKRRSPGPNHNQLFDYRRNNLRQKTHSQVEWLTSTAHIVRSIMYQ